MADVEGNVGGAAPPGQPALVPAAVDAAANAANALAAQMQNLQVPSKGAPSSAIRYSGSATDPTKDLALQQWELAWRAHNIPEP
jgi:hypothetical protein